MGHYCLKELKNTDPRAIIETNRRLELAFEDSLQLVKSIFDCAREFLSDYYVTEGQDPQKDMTFPIPIRDIAQACNFTLFEKKLARTDSMEVEPENGGGRTTIAQMQMRERRFITTPSSHLFSWERSVPLGIKAQLRLGKQGRVETITHQKEIAGTIVVDENLSEYAKRFAIAHELGHYVLRVRNPIGPLFIEDSCPGSFAYVPVKEFLANEFAYALLLPYELVERRKKQYEQQNKYNPLNYMDWINVLQDEAQIPEHYAILAYEEIKKYHILEEMQGSHRDEETVALRADMEISEDFMPARLPEAESEILPGNRMGSSDGILMEEMTEKDEPVQEDEVESRETATPDETIAEETP